MSELQPVQPLNPSPFKCLVATVGNIPTSFAQSLSYFEALQRLAKYIRDELIPAVNADTEAIEELQAKLAKAEEAIDVAVSILHGINKPEKPQKEYYGG